MHIVYPCKKATGILAGSWRDLGGIPAGSCRDFGRRDFRSPPWIPAGSHRDSRRVLPRFWPPGFPFPAVNPSGILAGLPPGSRRDFGCRDFAPRPESQRELGENSCRDFGRRGSASCRESRRDLGGLTHQDFGRRDSRFSLRILQRSRRDLSAWQDWLAWRLTAVSGFLRSINRLSYCHNFNG